MEGRKWGATKPWTLKALPSVPTLGLLEGRLLCSHMGSSCRRAPQPSLWGHPSAGTKTRQAPGAGFRSDEPKLDFCQCRSGDSWETLRKGLVGNPATLLATGQRGTLSGKHGHSAKTLSIIQTWTYSLAPAFHSSLLPSFFPSFMYSLIHSPIHLLSRH